MCLGPVQSVPECKELKGVLWYGRLSARGRIHSGTLCVALETWRIHRAGRTHVVRCRDGAAQRTECAMTAQEKILYTGKTHTTGGREGFARSDDARLRSGFRRLVATSREPIPSSFLPPAGRPVSSAHWGLPPRSVSCSSPPKRRSMRKSISPKRRAAFSFEHGLL